MSESTGILTSLTVGVIIAILGLIGVTWQLFRQKRNGKSNSTDPRYICNFHPTIDNRLQNIERRQESFDTQIAGLSRHMMAVEIQLSRLNANIDGKLDTILKARMEKDSD